jgi:hypothetical protein
LDSLGNAVVPQIPEMIGYAILESIQQEATHTGGQKLPEQHKEELENAHVRTL